MAISEEARHELYLALEQTIGHDQATTLMEHLPPVGWADVATKRDLDALENRVTMRFERVDERFLGVERRFDEVDRRFDEVERGFDQIDHRLDQMDHRFGRIDHRFDELERRFDRLDGLPGEFRSLLISVMTVMAVLFATMMGAVVAAIKL